ncbi:FKBP-type peptidyl-prolyl cis-trans isomerase [Oceanispirochaeta sp.]|jgi:FKBP-type peptidyl-prolyl cis-trans isomerase SlyD|uniref:FKBP-type peptidyl-prolyl cis-trans isomerase n=1 Tax=Oceanispirochaeta sp. TaxID=2035350 RepID=UPI0026031E32|nr:FKBP-type peptidyl-prolyl cis-trans isomerase [Oceanispirochaeta sp.]MDA3956046.1 FKBP-type peptidyl-prolyl cis-trans isomerase [Oceanispirochaeta sp.]
MSEVQNSITADFVLKRQDGTLIDSSEHSGAMNFIEGLNMMVPGIEKALKGLEEGTQFDITLDPADMYGLREESKVMEVSASDFHGAASELEVGTIIEAHTAEGKQLMTVKTIEGDKILLDANHPLAGESLQFSGTLQNVRPATEEELSALSKGGCGCGGHGEGCGGHGEGHGDGEGCGCDSKSEGQDGGCGCGNH